MSESLVSIVIPVRNEVANIEATLRSIREQDYAGPLEVVIADGMSDDGTRALLDTIVAADPHIRYLDNPTGRTPNGLNIAIGASQGSIIVRCDGHAELASDYISTAVSIMEETGAVNVGGIQAAAGITWTQRAIAYAMSSRIGVGNARFHYGGEPGPVDTVYLGVFRRDALLEVGMFDETLTRNQDYELNIRLRENGGIVWFDPRLSVVYRPRSSLRGLWSQYYQYGTWKRLVVKMHPESTKLRQLIPPLFVIALLISLALAFTPLRPWSLLVPGAYILMLAAATVALLLKTRDHAALGFPAAVATMHLSWGLAFLGAGRNGQSS